MGENYNFVVPKCIGIERGDAHLQFVGSCRSDWEIIGGCTKTPRRLTHSYNLACHRYSYPNTGFQTLAIASIGEAGPLGEERDFSDDSPSSLNVAQKEPSDAMTAATAGSYGSMA